MNVSEFFICVGIMLGVWILSIVSITLIHILFIMVTGKTYPNVMYFAIIVATLVILNNFLAPAIFGSW